MIKSSTFTPRQNVNYHGIFTVHSCEIHQIILCSSWVFVCMVAAAMSFLKKNQPNLIWFRYGNIYKYIYIYEQRAGAAYDICQGGGNNKNIVKNLYPLPNW